MSHPPELQLALYAGGELPFLERLRLRFHLRTCQRCRRTVEAFRQAQERFRDVVKELPEGLKWEHLAAEMTGNIRVGLEACAAISPVPARTSHGPWRPVAVMAGLAALVVSGWWLNFPLEQKLTLARNVSNIWNRQPLRLLQDPSVYLEVNRTGIRLSDNGSAMTMMHPGSAPGVVSVSTQGSIRASYVDDDTGQVTITNVYAQ